MSTPTPPSFFNPFIEPESAANTAYPPVYPYNNVTQTPSGHSFEMDDTPQRERVRLQHRMGTFIEMHPNGDEVHKVYGNGYMIVVRDNQVLISGNCNVKIEGDANIQISGDKIETVLGNVEQHIRGNFTQVVEGTTSLTSLQDTIINAGGVLGGGLKVQTGDYMYVDGDLSVNGEIVGTKIYSQGRIDAETGVGAGPLGFVTMLGGVSVGIPVAIPTTIQAAGPITSHTSVDAPLGLYGVSSSILGFDVINTLFYDSHIHATPVGPTTPTPSQFVGEA
jgi:hypothetical protein